MTPTLRVEEIDDHLACLVPGWADGDRAWLFLDYGAGDHEHFRHRWVILARRAFEDCQLVACWPSTAERALHLIPREVALARDAITAIRAALAALPSRSEAP